MQPVEYRRLGSSGLRVSVPILGCMSLGSSKWGKWVLDEEPSIELLKAAYDRGVTTFDTANMYSNGESERLIGRFMQKYSIPRRKVLIATKVYSLVAEDVGTNPMAAPGMKDEKDYVNQSGLSRAAIFNATDACLERLATPYIDLLQIHRFDPNTPVEETMKALHDLVQSGKVRYIGASSMRAWQFAELNHVAEKHGWTTFVSMQAEYSLLYREDEREMIPYCNAHGIGYIPWAPIASGTLARPVGTETTRSETLKGTPFERKLSDVDVEIISRVQKLSEKKNCSMAEISLAWVMTKIASPIVGVSSVERLEQNIVHGVEITEEDAKFLEEPYAPKPVRGHL